VDLCDRKVHQGLIVGYYHGRQNQPSVTAAMLDDLLRVVEIPTVGHLDAANWRSHRIADFEDALQVASAIAGGAEVIVTRNVSDFAAAELPAMTPEDFLSSLP
jgi:predicted nucleic-acid-binding protein